MTIRRAEEKDIPRLGELLLQVCRVRVFTSPSGTAYIMALRS